MAKRRIFFAGFLKVILAQTGTFSLSGLGLTPFHQEIVWHSLDRIATHEEDMQKIVIDRSFIDIFRPFHASLASWHFPCLRV
jgi:hypothetical protein